MSYRQVMKPERHFSKNRNFEEIAAEHSFGSMECPVIEKMTKIKANSKTKDTNLPVYYRTNASKRKKSMPHKREPYTVVQVYKRTCKIGVDFKTQLRKVHLRSNIWQQPVIRHAVCNIIEKYGFTKQVQRAMLLVVRELYEASLTLSSNKNEN